MDSGDGAVVAFRQATSNSISYDIEAVRMTAAGVAFQEVFITSNVALVGFNGSTTGPSDARPAQWRLLRRSLWAQPDSLDVAWCSRVRLSKPILWCLTPLPLPLRSPPPGQAGSWSLRSSDHTQKGGSDLINNVIGAFGTY